MLHLVLLLAASAMADPSYGHGQFSAFVRSLWQYHMWRHTGGGHSAGYATHTNQCQTVYDTIQETACHTEHEQVCNTEHDTVVETTIHQDCQDVVTQECHQVSQQVRHSSAVVGHSSHATGYAHHGHQGKREAEADAEAGHGGYAAHSAPQCHAKTERQCSQRPVQNSHQVRNPL